MIFDHKAIDEISDDELSSLIGKSREKQFLEFKLTIELNNDDQRLEMLCDIASLANGGGGYLVVGVRENKGIASRFEDLTEAKATSLKKAIIDSCHQHIKERIIDLTAEVRLIDSCHLVIVRIPSTSNPPHMVAFQDNTLFVSRYHDGKKAMSLAEIRDKIRNDDLTLQLTEMKAMIAGVTSQRKSSQELDAMLKRAREGRSARTLSTDGLNIHKTAYERFLQEAGEQRFFWIAATPMNTANIQVDPTSNDIRQLMSSPPGTTQRRRNGWGMQFDVLEPGSFDEGLRRGRKDYRYYEMLLNGHLELWVPMDVNFCWGQNEHEFERQPRLRPLVYTEFILCFFYFYNRLMEISGGTNQDSIYSIVFHNLNGFALPLSDWFPTAHTYEGHSFELLEQKFKNGSDPDLLAKSAVTRLQGAFNLPMDQIPYYDQTQKKFEFPL